MYPSPINSNNLLSSRFPEKKHIALDKKTSLLQNRPLGSELHSFFYDSPKAGFAPEDLSRKVGLFSILSFF